MAATISTTYTPEEREQIVAHVLAELSGGRAVSRILREDEDMPAARTFWNWYFADEELMQKVARARENGVEAMLDEAVDISDTQEAGEIVTVEGEKKTVKREDMLGHRRLRIDTRIKYAQMIAPRKYGPKLDLTSGNEPIQMDETSIAVRAAALIQKGLSQAADESE